MERSKRALLVVFDIDIAVETESYSQDVKFSKSFFIAHLHVIL